jgi:hypothetical protein
MARHARHHPVTASRHVDIPTAFLVYTAATLGGVAYTVTLICRVLTGG